MASEQGARKGLVHLVKKTFKQFSDDDCMSLAAGLAYYTIFALPPLLVILIAIGTTVFSRDQVEQTLETQMQGVLTAEQIDGIVARTQEKGAGWIASAISLVVLLVGATGAVAQLQTSLNRVWEVAPDPAVAGWRTFVTKRALSLLLILAVAFLLLLSLVLTSVLSGLGGRITEILPGELGPPVIWGANILVSWLIFTLLFAAVFKILPDAEIAWRDVAVGAAVTALLFMLGQFLLSLYMGNANIGSPYGAAGSLALILVWIYYSALILLIGAEFTQVWARRFGKQIQPSEGAVRAIHRVEHLRDSDTPSPRDVPQPA